MFYSRFQQNVAIDLQQLVLYIIIFIFFKYWPDIQWQDVRQNSWSSNSNANNNNDLCSNECHSIKCIQRPKALSHNYERTNELHTMQQCSNAINLCKVFAVECMKVNNNTKMLKEKANAKEQKENK